MKMRGGGGGIGGVVAISLPLTERGDQPADLI
jgi:hypothetical protein